jgi:hypothetical protein
MSIASHLDEVSIAYSSCASCKEPFPASKSYLDGLLRRGILAADSSSSIRRVGFRLGGIAGVRGRWRVGVGQATWREMRQNETDTGS